MDTGVKLTPTVEKKVSIIAKNYHAITGKTIIVTSGTRSPYAQAKAMFDNLKKRRSWLNVYKNQALAQPIGAAFDIAKALGLSDKDTIVAMEKVIAKQVSQRLFISKHLMGGAVDVNVKIMIQSDTQVFRKVALSVAKTVILETTNPHWHLQF